MKIARKVSIETTDGGKIGQNSVKKWHERSVSMEQGN